MPTFPHDAPKAKVVKTLNRLGFQIVREREHIGRIPRNEFIKMYEDS